MKQREVIGVSKFKNKKYFFFEEKIQKRKYFVNELTKRLSNYPINFGGNNNFIS
jgi:hypothetical protein